MSDWFNKAEQFLPDIGEDAQVASCSNVPMTEEDFHLLFETRDSLAACFYRVDKINEAIKICEPYLLKTAKSSVAPPFTDCPIELLNNECKIILFELESLVHLLAGHIERIGKLLEVHYGGICKGPLYMTIRKLPDQCVIKKDLLKDVPIFEYLHELRNYSLHKMSLSYILHIAVLKATLLIQLPDLACIKKETVINVPSQFTYNESRTVETEVTKWVKSAAKATQFIVSEYFNLRVERKTVDS
jgi:hypothetical protein